MAVKVDLTSTGSTNETFNQSLSRSTETDPEPTARGLITSSIRQLSGPGRRLTPSEGKWSFESGVQERVTAGCRKRTSLFNGRK